MSDLRERFKALDALETPDLQQEILARSPRRATVPSHRKRLAAVVVAGLVAVVGTTFGVWALLNLREGPKPLTERPSSPTPLQKVESIIDIRPFPGGAESPFVRGHLLARAADDEEAWTLSVTLNRRRDYLCLHLNSGVGCGGPTRPGTPAGSIGYFSSSSFSAPDSRWTFVYGAVVKPVAEVTVSFSDGTTLRTKPIEGPPGFEVNFYVVGVRGTPPLATVRALDREGTVLGTVGPP